jgi:NMD protein affecting ribosome stability and mRNA decay
MKKKTPQRVSFRGRCCECGKRAYIITHHIIPKHLVDYLISVCNFDRGDMITLRNQLTVRICKDCERKFHTGEFYKKWK